MAAALIESDKASNQLSFKNAPQLCAFIVLATTVSDLRASEETDELILCGCCFCVIPGLNDGLRHMDSCTFR